VHYAQDDRLSLHGEKNSKIMLIFNHRPIYLDHQATTPLDPSVLAAMAPYWTEEFGNPASGHAYGWAAAAAIEVARQQIALAIGAQPAEIIFTSGATEANSLILRGIAEAQWPHGRHIVTSTTEHSSILAPCKYLEQLGFEVTYLGVDDQGLIRPKDLAAALRSDTILVSIMAAHNEIGVLQPLPEIAQICQARRIPFHSDAAQALGKIDLNVQRDRIDALSLTAHKIYGPKGIGALYLRRGLRCIPQQLGGGQEQNRRSGTLATPLIVGWGQAAQLASQDRLIYTDRLTNLRDRLWQQLQSIPGVILNGSLAHRLPDNLHLSFPQTDSASLLREIWPLVALSSGSACSSGQPSHVMAALGRNPAWASLRFSLGRSTTTEEIDRIASATIAAIKSLQS
jgi:cysteine desulfurase